jgi:hypothetical protein
VTLNRKEEKENIPLEEIIGMAMKSDNKKSFSLQRG